MRRLTGYGHELVNLRQRDIEADATQAQPGVQPVHGVEGPLSACLPTIDLDRCLVLIDLDDFRDALDILQMAPPLDSGSPRAHLGGRDHVEDGPREVAAAHHGIGNAGCGKLLLSRCGAAARLRAAAVLVAAQAVAQGGPETHEDSGMIRGRRCVRNNLAVYELVSPGVTELALVGSQKLVSRPTATSCARRVVHVVLRRGG